MLQVNYIRENKDTVEAGLTKKGFKNTEAVPQLLDINQEHKRAKAELERLEQQRNTLSAQIGQALKNKETSLAEIIKKDTVHINQEIERLKNIVNELAEKQKALLITLPNLPQQSVPAGKTAADNQLIFPESEDKMTALEITLPENALPHWELARKYNLIDFELGVKITGAGFPVYLGKGAKLQRALISFFLDEATKAGYTEVQPPLLVNEASAFGTGQLPDKEGQMYHTVADNLYLIPTAEVPLTNLYRNCILKHTDLPIKNTAYSACFRREAGSYGKDVKGLNRLHQFDKVELVEVVLPEKAEEAFKKMCEHVENLLKALELPYRILNLCGGDLSFASAKTYDFEVYSAAQKRWLEVSSVSNFGSFQANRLKLRYKNEAGETEFAHTLNGSALALPRIVAALLENHQSEKTIRMPKVLIPYTGFEYIARPTKTSLV